MAGRTCERCGASLKRPGPHGYDYAQRWDARFCSDACRTKAWRERRREEIATATAAAVRKLPATELRDLLAREPTVLRTLARYVGVIDRGFNVRV